MSEDSRSPAARSHTDSHSSRAGDPASGSISGDDEAASDPESCESDGDAAQNPLPAMTRIESAELYFKAVKLPTNRFLPQAGSELLSFAACSLALPDAPGLPALWRG